MFKIRFISMLVLLMTAVTGAWATPNSIVINGTPQVGDKSISLTYYFDPANVPGITGYAPTLKVKCAADNKYDEMVLSLIEVSSGTTSITLNTLGEFEAGKTYEVCFAYYNGNWVDEVFQSFVPAGYTVSLKDGTEDATSWQGKAGEGNYQALPLTGLEPGTAVSVKYSGWKLVKSVKAKKNPIAEDKGKLICTDGHIHAYGEDAECTKARVAKIIYVGPTGHATYKNGLALALTDERYNTSWGAAMTACNNKNTSTPVTDATWLLASKDQWDYMLGANGASSYIGLRDGFSSVGGSNLSGAYWSSTEHEPDDDEYPEAWCYVFSDGNWGYNRKDKYCRARACLAFLAKETVTLNHSANHTWAIAEMPAGDVELEVEYFNITVPTANTADIYAGFTTPLINAGSTTEDGATMKYLVTATNEQPTSTDGFSADVPTAQGLTAGTYYVWYYLDFASGDDSDISALAVEVTVNPVPHYAITVKEGTEDATSWQGKAGTGEYQALPLEGVALGTAVSVKYSGRKLVKSVNAKKKATAKDKGKLICTDGHIHAYGEDAECTKARVAKIVYVGPTGHATYTPAGLALALTDEDMMYWDPAMTACNNKNTSTPITNATWLLASKDQWNYMMGTDGAGNYFALRTGFSSVGGSNMSSYHYWSSTDAGSNNAWDYDFYGTGWYYHPKGEYQQCVRACLAFGALETVTLNHSANNTWAIAEMPYGDVEQEVEYFNITVPTANTADIYPGSTTPLINAGSTTEDGATMKYLVTATNEQPTSTDGFSADVPTALPLTRPGTYYVWYYLDFASGDDSDISALAVEVTVSVPPSDVTMKEGTLDATSWQGKAGEGEYQALPLTGLEAGTAVSVKYNGTKKVKSVKAKKKATAKDKGKLICTDGHIHAYGEDAECTADRVAKIIYIGPTGHATYNHGLALALTDERSVTNWPVAMRACDSKNTSTPVTDATWLLASKDQWDYMLGADGAGSYTALRDGFSSVGGSNLQSVGYWSSTEIGSVYAWDFHFDDGLWYLPYKDDADVRARACLAFGALDPDPIELTSTDGETWTLASMPAFDVVLEVEYETALALSETTDNSAALTEWNGYEADVTLTRTLAAGSYNTFAAPFSTAIPSGWTVKELSSTSFADGTLTLKFATAASIEAGKPYLVKVAANTDLSTAPFTGVIVSKDTQPFTSTDVDFIPTLGATTIEGNDTKAVLFLEANNTLLNPSALPADIKGFRAYFQLKGETASLARAFSIDFGDGETTGIIAIGTDRAASTDNATYTLDGRRISKATQKGVYIQNGKKVIINMSGDR